MTPLSVRRIGTLDRFHLRGAARRLLQGSGSLFFKGTSHFYHCPVCAKKTLVDHCQLDAFNPAPSIFPPQLQSVFDQVELSHHDAAHDFYCGGCGRPVRLLYWTQERGMGGPWDSFVKVVLELDGEQGGDGFV